MIRFLYFPPEETCGVKKESLKVRDKTIKKLWRKPKVLKLL